MSVYSRPYESREGSEIQGVPAGFAVEFREASHRYWLMDGGKREPVVSVTTALGVLEKRGLMRWFEDGGAWGALKLLDAQWPEERELQWQQLQALSPRDIGDLVRDYKLGAEAMRDAAADRGTTIHRVLQLYAEERVVPNIADFPEEHHGYVQGLARWLLAAGPTPILVEQFVASPTYGYAGRLDLMADVRGESVLVDLKTSKTGVPWSEAHAQCQAYKIAAIESGFPSPERLMIVGVGEDGQFVEAPCCAVEQDWLDLLQAYRTVSRLRSDVRAQINAREAQ